MANAQDERQAQQQALEAARKERLTSEQQQAREKAILQQLQREREKKQNPEAAAARKQAERDAHRQAVQEAQQIAKETPGSQRITVRTDHEFAPDSVSSSSRITGRTSGRSRSRSQEQFSQSGDPVNLQGDPAAIQQVRAQAFQQAREKAARSGGTVTEAAINRETRNILAQSGGRVSVIDESSRRDAITEGYRQLKGQKPIPESDMAIMTPVSGIRSRSTYEGFFEGGGRTTVSIGPPKVEKVTADLPPPPDDFFEGVKTNLQNLAVDFELGAKGAGIGIGSIFSFANPNAQKNLIKEAEKQGQIAESKTGRELEREFVGATIQSGIGAAQGKPTTEGFSQLGKDIVESPSFFAGSAASSAALYLTPFGISKLVRNIQSARYGFSVSKPFGKRIPEGAQDVAVEDYGAFIRGEIPIRSGSPAEHYRHLARLSAKQQADAARFKMPELAYPFKKRDVSTLGSPVVYASAFRPSTVIPRTATVIPKAATLAPEFERPDVPLITAPRSKKITTLADIDKRLGLDVRDKGDFSEVRTRTGQVLLVKKPIQIQKPLVITKQETMLTPPRLTTKTVQRQQTRSIQQFMLGFGGQTGAERVIAKRLRQRQGLLFNTPQIEREAIQQAQSLSFSQQSLFGQQQSFKSMFKQNQITKMLQLERQQLKFKPITLERQLFRFVFPRPTRTTTTFNIPPPPSPPPLIPTTTIPTPPAFPWLMGAPRYGQKKTKKGRVKATPREGQIKDLISASLGDSNKFAKSFRKRFGKMF